MGRALTAALTKLQKSHKDSIRDVETSAIIDRYFLDSPQLNFLFGGGYPVDRIVQFHGPESSGKSTLATYIGGQLQKREEKNVVIYVDFERTFEKEYARNLGLDLDPKKFIFLRPENGEEAFTIVEELVRTGEIALIIWDSDSTTATKSQIGDEYGKANFGGVAKLMSEGLRKFNPILEKFKTSLIMISQERDNIGALYGPDYKVTGGRAIKFYASNRSRITRIGYIKEKGVTIGIEMRVKNGKNKAGIPFREAELTLMFDGGFDTEKEYMDFIVMLGIVEQKGAYFRSSKYDFNLQGRTKLQEWLDEHPAEYDEIKQEINRRLCGETILDEDNEAPEDDDLPIRGMPESDILNEAFEEQPASDGEIEADEPPVISEDIDEEETDEDDPEEEVVEE